MMPIPRLIAWELTRHCNLRCAHCRANAGMRDEGRGKREEGDELSLEEAKRVVDDIVSFAKPILILTGGEPLLCPYHFELIAYAREKGLRPVIGTNATMIDAAAAAKIAAAGVTRISVSIDFPMASDHDRFRGVVGAFDAALRGIRAAIRAGVEVQINSTVTKLNRTELSRLHDLAVEVGAKAFHPFLLVLTGRGADLTDAELSAAEYEEALSWICRRSATSPLELTPTDAPQYQRILRQQGLCPSHPTRGCLAGTGFAFIGHKGDVQPCGYFDLKLGNVRKKPFSRIWAESPVLDDLRHPERLKGKCGICEYKNVCGGCRARALAKTGDYLAEEPSCAHVPDRALLDLLQTDFPLAARPYAALGEKVGLAETECYERVERLSGAGLIRRIGASFDSRKLGYVSTLVAAKVDGDSLEAVAAKVNAFPEVTHNYARSGEFNLWFTVIAQTPGELESVVEAVRREEGVERVIELPATRTYKLRAVFGADARDARPCQHLIPVGSRVPRDRSAALVRKFQGDILHLGLRPFAEDEILQLRELAADGALRRFGAIVNHRNAGARANALTAWQVSETDCDKIGAAFAEMGYVSHCYAREKPGDWPYSLYAMVHAGSDAELSGRIEELAAAAWTVAGAEVRSASFVTQREYKKTSPRYFVV